MFVGGNTNKKDDLVQTPDWLVEKIYKQISRKQFKNILDVGAFDGALSNPFKRIKGSHITGVDIVDDYSNNFDYFIHEQFLLTTKEDYEHKPDLIIMNPPFSQLQPMQFIEHCIKLFGGTTPIISIAPAYILGNSAKRANRLNELNITRVVILNKETFYPVQIESNVIFFNIHFRTKPAYEYWIKNKEKKGKYRSVYMNRTDEDNIKILLKKYNGNFNRMIKSLIENEVERLK